MIHRIPTYTQRLKSSKPITKTSRWWDTSATDQLRCSFVCTDWSVFQDACASLNELTETVTDYVNFCMDCCVPEKTISVFPNNKPWVTKEVRTKVKGRHQVLRQGDKTELLATQADLKAAITKCKEDYRHKIEDKFISNNPRDCWLGLTT